MMSGCKEGTSLGSNSSLRQPAGAARCSSFGNQTNLMNRKA